MTSADDQSLTCSSQTMGNESAKSKNNGQNSGSPFPPTEVTLFYTEVPSVLSIDPEIEVSLQNPSFSDLSKIAQLQQNCPDFKLIYDYLQMTTSLMIRNFKTKSFKIQNIMNSVMVSYIIGFKDGLNVKKQVMLSLSFNLPCQGFSDLMPLKPIMTTMHVELIWVSKK